MSNIIDISHRLKKQRYLKHLDHCKSDSEELCQLKKSARTGLQILSRDGRKLILSLSEDRKKGN